MPFDPNDPKGLTELRESIEASLQDLKPFREHYHKYLREMVGVYYSKNGNSKVVPVNLLELATTIYLQQLLALPPRVNVTTFNRGIRPAGVKLKQAVNDSLRDYSIFEALQRATRTAIGSIGIVKVGVESKGQIEVDGQVIYKNRPFVEHIQIDDWVHDMGSKAIGKWTYCGHRFEMELDEALNNPDFDPEERARLQAIENKKQNQQGDMRASQIQGNKASASPFKKMVELWEIFLPKEQLVLTLSLDGGSKKPLKIVQWKGPERGPFHLLYFAEVDGNSMPLAPSQLWMGMHLIVNGLYRKLDRQSSRQKTVGLLRGQDAKTGQIINALNDGEWAVVDDPAACKEVSTGGIHQGNFAFMLQSKDLFSWLAGNLETIGGLGPGSDTLGQDRILNANSSQRVTMMQNSVTLFTKRVLTDFAFYLWEDPIESYNTEIRIPGFGPIQSSLTPADRTHDFFEHQLDIEPYSMQFQTPGERLQKLNQILTGFLMPAQPMMQAQGLTIDWQTILKLQAEYNQLPELESIVDLKGQPLDSDTAAPQPQGQQQGGGGAPQIPKPPAVNHRISHPGRSNRQQQDAMTIHHLLGGKVQNSEMAGSIGA
jgi:hypothetical protein